MERYIINGSLYVKKRPSIKREDILLKQNFLIYNATIGKEITIKSIKDLESLPSIVIDVLRKQGAITTKETIIHDNFGFYQIFATDTSIYMLGKETNKIFEYHSLEELDKDFISLEDFLNRAVYVGSELIGRNGSAELLYEFEDMWLISSNSNDLFITIGRHNEVMYKYKLGFILPHYYSKEEVYQAIIESYLNKNNGETRK